MKTTLRLLTLGFALAAALPALAGERPIVIEFPNNLLLPPMGVYAAGVLPHLLADIESDGIIKFPGTGVVVSKLRLVRPDHSDAPPPFRPGGNQTHSLEFGMRVHMDVQMGAGSPVQHISALATVSFTITAIDATHYSTEMLALNIQGGDLPAGVMVRESPTLASAGTVNIQDVSSAGNYLIDSFFDVFTEISTDGGQTWVPAAASERLTLIAPSGENTFATPNLPPPAPMFSYVPTFAGGLVIRNAVLVNPTNSSPPPPSSGGIVVILIGLLAGEVSTDGGQTFTPFRAPCNMTERITSYLDSGNTRFFDTEMLALDVSGGTLPAGVMIRESPTEPSLGRTSITTVPDGTYRIGSFFDVFTELSVNGGNTWMPCLSGPCTFALPAVPMHAELWAKGDIAPSAGVLGSGVPADALLTFVGLPCINARGDVAVLVKWGSKTMGNGSGIAGVLTGATIETPDSVSMVVHNGSSVNPDRNVASGNTIDGFTGDAVLGEDGTLLFMATVKGPGIDKTNNSAVCALLLAAGGAVAAEIVAQQNMPAPGVPGAVFSKFSSETACGNGCVLLTGYMKQDGRTITAANDYGLWFFDNTGFGQLVFQEGRTMVGAKTVKIIGGLTARSKTPGARFSNDNLELVTKLTFTDNSFAAVHTMLRP